ncbi:MAG: MFS transporter, partial [Selenomonadaceae bacterium]|nr:MFS transporter [Selenomonadaceae bacterium]
GMYASMGFQTTYIFLAASVLIITLISCFTLKTTRKSRRRQRSSFPA